MYKDLHFYILFDCEEYINLGKTYLNNIKQMTDFAYMHKVSVFHSKEQLQHFVSKISNLDENFIESTGNLLEIILKNSLAKKENKYIFDVLFSHEYTTIQKSKMLGISPNKQIAIISTNLNACSKYLLYAKSKDEVQLLNVNRFNNRKDIVRWISLVIPRIFNKSPKHGENGKGNWRGESCLLCSCQKAQALLDTSIPDLELIDSRLFNYDPIHKTYIEFFFEGLNPQKQWHGFHLDKKDWQRVPPNIRAYFNI